MNYPSSIFNNTCGANPPGLCAEFNPWIGIAVPTLFVSAVCVILFVYACRKKAKNGHSGDTVELADPSALERAQGPSPF